MSPPNRFRGTYNSGGFSLGFPPFTPAVKLLIIINVAVYFLMLFGNIGLGAGFTTEIQYLFGFIPLKALNSGWLWQFVTYGFIHVGLMHVLINMLTLWMFGSSFEQQWGKKQFLEFYFFCLIGAAITTLAMGWIGYGLLQHDVWTAASGFWGSLATLLKVPTVGASGAIYGILMAFGIIFGDQEIFLFPFPFRIKAKYFVGILILVIFATALQPGMSGVANIAHLGGLFFGFVYVKWLPKRGLGIGLSEQYFGLRNSYYRWKRRRAAKKFEVYMRKYDRNLYFDEYGNYKGPKGDEPKKGDGENRPPWVN